VDLLERALAEVVRRHDVMRTTFQIVDGRPVQIVHPDMPVAIAVLDLRSDPDADAQALRRLRESRSGFDLTTGPLLELWLFRIADEGYVLGCRTHHLISDGWSDDVLIREITTGYLAFAADQQPQLPSLPIQYADYAIWQRDQLQGRRLDDLLSHWREQLAGAPTSLELPLDHPRPNQQTFVAATYPIDIPAGVTARLVALGQAERATLFMTTLAAVAVLLGRYSGQDDILIGSPVANRTRVETEGLIGCFINTLVLRARLSGNPTFRDLVGRMRETALTAYAHQDMPFERLVEELQPDRDTSRNPLFQVMFALQNSPRAELAIGDISLVPMEIDNGVAKFDITIDIHEYEGALTGRVQFDSALFDPATCERFLGQLIRVLDVASADPDRPIRNLPILRDDELETVLVDWNATDRAHDIVGIHELFAARAAEDPAAVAVTAPDGDLTRGELVARASAVAARLRTLDVGPDTRVCLYVERSTDLAVGILGILGAGGAYVPLDPAYPRDRVAFVVEDAAPAVVVTQSRLLGGLPLTDADIVCLDTMSYEVEPAPLFESPIDPDHLAYMIYTSGSTGVPKGVMISHRAVTNMILSTIDHIEATASDVVLQYATCCFDVSVLELFLAFSTGARLVIPSAETVLSPTHLTRLMQEEKASIVDIPPAMLELLPDGGFPDLRIQFIGCEAFSGDLATRWQAPGRRLINGYGPTEATVMMTLEELRGTYDRMPPIGTPMPNHQAYVLDHRMLPKPVGAVGELYIGGTGLARGYFGRPDLTADRFVPNPFGAPGSRLYRTGDLARYRPDGVLEFRGRADLQVKIRGHRVELEEIESALALHPDVMQAVAVLRESEDAKGVLRKRIDAYVLPQPGSALAGHELRDWAKERLPQYMVPSAVVLVSQFPVLASGKVDRSALAEPDVRVAGGTDYAPPRTEIEELLAGTVFAEILGVDRVGIHDGFFDLGGDSLQLAAAQAQIAELLDVDIPLRTLFEAQSIAELSAYLHDRETGEL
jgi:amino acid adenylation domain-containing protein